MRVLILLVFLALMQIGETLHKIKGYSMSKILLDMDVVAKRNLLFV